MMKEENGKGPGIEEEALLFLPLRLREAVLASAGGRELEEIRLRSGGWLTVTADGRSIPCGTVCRPGEVEETVERLCGGSLYAQADNIRQGVIVTSRGIRAGVCGQAAAEGERILSVRDVTSVNLRLPHRRPGAADALFPLAAAGKSILVCSPPGRGKTTVLRELAARLASPGTARRVAVIDTRYELSAGLCEAVTADFFRGYPKAAGMKAAVRSMAPETVICDEIAGVEDAEAVRAVRHAGIAVAASAHADSAEAAGRLPGIGELLEEGCFDALCVIGPERKCGVTLLG